MHTPTAREIMSKKFISVSPDNTVLQVFEVMVLNKLAAVPMRGSDDKFLGVITEYDLLENGLSLYLPTFEKMLVELSVPDEHQENFKRLTEDLKNKKIGEMVNKKPITFHEDTSFSEMLKIFCLHHAVNSVPVLGDNEKLEGMITRFDILKLFADGYSEVN